MKPRKRYGAIILCALLVMMLGSCKKAASGSSLSCDATEDGDYYLIEISAKDGKPATLKASFTATKEALNLASDVSDEDLQAFNDYYAAYYPEVTMKTENVDANTIRIVFEFDITQTDNDAGDLFFMDYKSTDFTSKSMSQLKDDIEAIEYEIPYSCTLK
jgi:hypothetical protein